MDPIAKKYYEIVEFYDEHFNPIFSSKHPFENEENIEHIVQTFYESVKYENLYVRKNRSKAVLKIIEQQKQAIQYLKEHLVEALFCEERYIRELAKLIYQDTKEKK